MSNPSGSRKRSSSDARTAVEPKFAPPETEPEDSALSPRSRSSAARKLRSTRTLNRNPTDAKNAQEIFAIEQEGEAIETKLGAIVGNIDALSTTNSGLSTELARLREELASVQKQDVSHEDEQLKKLQRALNSRQRDINVMEMQIQKLDRQAEKYRKYTFVLSQVMQRLMSENDELRRQFNLERADITPEGLQYAAELIFKKMMDKLGSLSLVYASPAAAVTQSHALTFPTEIQSEMHLFLSRLTTCHSYQMTLITPCQEQNRPRKRTETTTTNENCGRNVLLCIYQDKRR